MKVLVTNDDGIKSPGLHALAQALVATGRDVVVVAPDRDMSGSGAAIGHIHIDEAIGAEKVELPGLAGVPAYAIDGPPGLCVLTARLGGFGTPPDLVVSGINAGCNTGRAILHSGTVGGALTAANFGGRGLAVSIDVLSTLAHEQAGGVRERVVPVSDGERAAVDVVDAPDGSGSSRGNGDNGDNGASGASGALRQARVERVPGVPGNWRTAATVAAAALDWLCDAPEGTVLNLNVPDLPLADLEGARPATLAPFGTVRSTVVESAEDGGRLQLELRPTSVDLPPDCDTALVAAGYVAVSAITGIRLDEAVSVGAVLEAVMAEASKPGAT
jgi:5'-nucleotidase